MAHTARSLAESLIADYGRNREVIAEAEASVGRVPRFPAAPAPSDAAEVSRPEPWLLRLMECPSWSGRRLDREEELSLWVAAELRRLTRSGALRAVWSRLPAEIRRGGRIASMQQTLGRVMGVVKGAPDFWFAWGTGAGLVELKTERAQGDMLEPGRRRTYMRAEQRDFREWAVGLGVKHAVCRSVPEVVSTLREWGRI